LSPNPRTAIQGWKSELFLLFCVKIKVKWVCTTYIDLVDNGVVVYIYIYYKRRNDWSIMGYTGY